MRALSEIFNKNTNLVCVLSPTSQHILVHPPIFLGNGFSPDTKCCFISSNLDNVQQCWCYLSKFLCQIWSVIFSDLVVTLLFTWISRLDVCRGLVL